MCLITVQDVEIPDPHHQTANLKHEFCHRREIKSRDAKGKLILHTCKNIDNHALSNLSR